VASRMRTIRPLRDLLQRLPELPQGRRGGIDFGAADPDLMAAIADDADTAMRTVHLGISAIGNLLAHSAALVEDGTIGADCIESLGFLMTELGDLAAECMTLAASCRRQTAQQKSQLQRK
jgi:hypothetical protein